VRLVLVHVKATRVEIDVAVDAAFVGTELAAQSTPCIGLTAALFCALRQKLVCETFATHATGQPWYILRLTAREQRHQTEDHKPDHHTEQYRAQPAPNFELATHSVGLHLHPQTRQCR